VKDHDEIMCHKTADDSRFHKSFLTYLPKKETRISFLYFRQQQTIFNNSRHQK